jgi:hypothetical protein
MIRWYDYPASFLFAYMMLALFFNYAMLGGILAYGVYKLWIDMYCDWRHKQEHGY